LKEAAEQRIGLQSVIVTAEVNGSWKEKKTEERIMGQSELTSMYSRRAGRVSVWPVPKVKGDGEASLED
jgi:hypothetical protein